MCVYHVTYSDTRGYGGQTCKLSASSDPNPINITVRRLTADLHDVNGVDTEEADGVTLSLIRALYVPVINHVTLCSTRALCTGLTQGARTADVPDLWERYGFHRVHLEPTSYFQLLLAIPEFIGR